MKKFDVVITNPPYNSKRGDNNQSVDIYHSFIDKAFDLSKRYVIMITKSNWMIKPTMKSFRDKMIRKYNVDKISHYEKNPFNGTEIKGGVSYFVIDNENTKDTFKLNGVTYNRNLALHFLPYDLNYDELLVLNKIINLEKIDMSNFRAKGYYNIKCNDVRLEKENENNCVECHVSEKKGKIMYFPKGEFNKKISEDILKYKIFTSSSYSPNKLGRVFFGVNQLNSESLVNWVFDSEEDMKKFYKYINTKFFRFCISLINNKIDIGKTTFSLVPKIDFSKLDKIDDENIYRYLNLTEEDIKTIENRCEKLNLFLK